MNDKLLSLMHGETSDKKKQYNAEYYRAHKDYWKQYRETGQGIGRKTSNSPVQAKSARERYSEAYQKAVAAGAEADRIMSPELKNEMASKVFNGEITREAYNKWLSSRRRKYDELMAEHDTLMKESRRLYDLMKQADALQSANAEASKQSAENKPYAKIKQKHGHSGSGRSW